MRSLTLTHTGAILFIEEDLLLTDWQIEVIVASLNIVAAVGERERERRIS